MGLIPEDLKPDLIVDYIKDESIRQILDFTSGIGLDAAVVCTDNISANDWTLHQLHPKGISVVLGLPLEGLRFDAFNLVFREIIIKGSLHSSVESMRKMIQVVADYKIRSEITIVPLDEAETLPERFHKHELRGRAVVTINQARKKDRLKEEGEKGSILVDGNRIAKRVVLQEIVDSQRLNHYSSLFFIDFLYSLILNKN
jgi:hypothetical protein